MQTRTDASNAMFYCALSGFELSFWIIRINVLFSFFQVDLTRSFLFRNSGQSYTGIPIMAANMDTVGTFEMAKTLGKVCNITWSHQFTFYCIYSAIRLGYPSLE